jgi:hypothetical protein
MTSLHCGPYIWFTKSSLPIEENYARFEVFTAVTMKNAVFWDATLCDIEIELHPYNINIDGGFCLSKSWKPLIGTLKAFGV